jgi:hypothetical protein
MADQQAALAKSKIGIDIAQNEADAVKKTADGQAYKLTEVGKAEAVGPKELGLAIAAGYEAQQQALGKTETAFVNAVKAMADGKQRYMPEYLVLTVGGEGGLSSDLKSMIPALFGRLGIKTLPGTAPAPESHNDTPPAAKLNGAATDTESTHV